MKTYLVTAYDYGSYNGNYTSLLKEGESDEFSVNMGFDEVLSYCQSLTLRYGIVNIYIGEWAINIRVSEKYDEIE